MVRFHVTGERPYPKLQAFVALSLGYLQSPVQRFAGGLVVAFFQAGSPGVAGLQAGCVQGIGLDQAQGLIDQLAHSGYVAGGERQWDFSYGYRALHLPGVQEATEGPFQGFNGVSQLVRGQCGHLNAAQPVEQLSRFGAGWRIFLGHQPPLKVA